MDTVRPGGHPCLNYATSMQPETPDAALRPGHLTVWDTVSIILGIVIGAGIYETAPLVFRNVPNAAAGLTVWLAGGLLSLVGALCYAELATTYPRSGGDYVYLTRAYGRMAGFLFGWSQLAVLMTGSIGMMAYIFADYAARLWNLNEAWKPALAGASVIVFTTTNLIGVVLGRRTQNVLTLIKILGISGILAAGFLCAKPAETMAGTASETGGAIGLAMIMVLYTYGGWNDAALVAAEIHDPCRNIPRALVLGTVLLTMIYLLVNAAYLAGLGFEKARSSGEIAADLLQTGPGQKGASAISLLVMISALGAMNGLVYTGSRIYVSFGTDFRWFSALAKWQAKRRTPAISLSAQCIITLLLVFIVGTNAGRSALNALLETIAIGGVAWQGHGGFETLLRCTAPVFWLFFLGTGVSLFVLRQREPNRIRPFRAPFYPVVPALFCAVCAYMLYSSAIYAGKLLIVGLLPLLLGVITYFTGGRSASIVEPVPHIHQETPE